MSRRRGKPEAKVKPIVVAWLLLMCFISISLLWIVLMRGDYALITETFAMLSATVLPIYLVYMLASVYEFDGSTISHRIDFGIYPFQITLKVVEVSDRTIIKLWRPPDLVFDELHIATRDGAISINAGLYDVAQIVDALRSSRIEVTHE